MNSRGQSGNVLFLILIAVALFAALSYAITRSTNGGAQNAGNENADIAVSQILQWFSAIDAAVLRMNTVRKIPYDGISFTHTAKQYNETILNNWMNNTSCTLDSCRMFMPSGGGVSSANFSKHGTESPTGIIGTNMYPGYFYLVMMQWPYAGTSANDVVLFMSYIKPDICLRLNKKLDISLFPTYVGQGCSMLTPS